MKEFAAIIFIFVCLGIVGQMDYEDECRKSPSCMEREGL